MATSLCTRFRAGVVERDPFTDDPRVVRAVAPNPMKIRLSADGELRARLGEGGSVVVEDRSNVANRPDVVGAAATHAMKCRCRGGGYLLPADVRRRDVSDRPTPAD